MRELHQSLRAILRIDRHLQRTIVLDLQSLHNDCPFEYQNSKKELWRTLKSFFKENVSWHSSSLPRLERLRCSSLVHPEPVLCAIKRHNSFRKWRKEIVKSRKKLTSASSMALKTSSGGSVDTCGALGWTVTEDCRDRETEEEAEPCEEGNTMATVLGTTGCGTRWTAFRGTIMPIPFSAGKYSIPSIVPPGAFNCFFAYNTEHKAK